MTFVGFLMNVLMAGLLLATLIYCLKLNKRIKVLQDSKSELARIIREFDDSTQRATQNINEIHAATMRISDNIQHKIDKANFLANDLEMLVQRGNKITGKTEAPPMRPAPSTQPTRTMADIMPGRTAEPGKVAETTTGTTRPLRMRSRAEQELLNLIGNKNTDDSNR